MRASVFGPHFFTGVIMNLNHPSKAFSQLTHNELSKKSAIHEAGHAVAIYLGNRQKQLSPFFFQIYIKEQSSNFQLSRSLCILNDKCMAKLEDDCLIQTLPLSIGKATKDVSSEQMQASECAFEADVISLLVGPLAEAKYEAMRDGELINPRLVNLNALHYYGGSSDLEIVNEYLECFIVEEAEREKKISGLFLDAFSFINDRSNWLAITMLANYILTGRKNIIDREEVMPYLITGLSDID
jgi:hypothetical protein